jgi:hypothetical protein
MTPDQSRFTACVIGEATPAEQASFDAAILDNAALRAEAVTLSRSANRLATALKQEAPVTLTPAQRQAIFEHGATRTSAKPRRNLRPVWFGPTLATAGIAAAVVLGFQALPGFRDGPPAPVTETGIPAIAIRPESPAKTGARPVVPPPSLAKGTAPVMIPAPGPPASPSSPGQPPAMAATPPVIIVDSVPAGPDRNPSRDLPPAAKIKTGKNPMDGSLANPGPRRP